METNMTFIDHLFFVALNVGYPIASFFSFRRLMRRVAAGETVSPMEIYRSTLIGHWILFGIALAIWLGTNRSWDALGFGLDVGAGFLLGLALTVAATVALIWHFSRVTPGDQEARATLRHQLGDLAVMLPTNRKQLRAFYAVSATAGIVEETLWRGYMFWYLGHVMPLWVAAIVSSVVFGLLHIYQGTANALRVIPIGAVLGGLYLLTGSVWLPIILHAVFDAVQGRGIYSALSRAPQPQSAPAR